MNEQAVQDAVAENYELLRHHLPYARTYHDWWLGLMAQLADRPGRILDNGCGVGPLFAHLTASKQVFGCDLSSEMLQRAKDRLTHATYLVQSNSLGLPFEAGSFDTVFSRALIHHLPSPELGISEIRRVLKPGGQAIFADTNRSLISTLPRRIAYRGDQFSDEHSNLHRSDYLKWISDHLEISSIRFFGYLAYPFGFPDMMGPFRRIPFPSALVRVLIQLDNIIARMPILKTQSWGIIVSAYRGDNHET